MWVMKKALGDLVFPDLDGFKITTGRPVNLAKTFPPSRLRSSKSLQNYFRRGLLKSVRAPSTEKVFTRRRPRKPPEFGAKTGQI